MLDGNGGQELVRGGVDLFSREESMRCGREVTGALTGSTGILNGKREQDSKLVLGCKENFGESISQRTPIEAWSTGCDQPKPWRSNAKSGSKCEGNYFV